jgi:hypothetical protein
MQWTAHRPLAHDLHRLWPFRRNPGPARAWRRAPSPAFLEVSSLLFFLLLIAATFVF